MNLRSVLLAALVMAGAIGFAIFAMRSPKPPPAAALPPEPATPAEAPPAPPQLTAPAAGPAPIPVVEPDSDVTEQGLGRLLATKPAILQAKALVQLDDLPHRVAATVDSLPREHSPVSVWPLSPVPGRFRVTRSDNQTTISPDNAERYAPYVALLEQLPVGELIGIYRHFLPLFQQAYRDLGYPTGAFSDRLLAAIDQLLATPDPTALPGVHLPEMQSDTPPPRPWVLYEFDDPALERLAAGQKILVRMGSANARRVKAVLRVFRSGIAPAPQRS